MALIKCKECNNEVSTNAISCPQCSARVVPRGCIVAAITLLALPLVICILIFANAPDDKTAQSNTAAQEKLDATNDVVGSCNSDEIQKYGISLLSWEEEAKICKTVTTTLGQLPPINILRMAFKSTAALQYLGDQDAAPDIAYQLMNIVEARGSSRPERISGTLDTVCKIYDGTQGHVTPKDILIMLHSAGPIAHTLSDEGLISMASLLWEEKKDHGE